MSRDKFIRLDVREVSAGESGKTTPYYSIIYEDENGDEHCGYSSYDLDVISSYLKVYFGVNRHLHKAVLYHCTTPKKAKMYHDTGAILKPVRGFTTLQAAMAWCIHTGRTVIYEIKGGPAYKLPDHHNRFGEAWWIDEDVPIDRIKAVRFDIGKHKCSEVKETEE